MISSSAYAALAQGQTVEPFSIERRDLRPDDAAMDILYCGICHTDLHMIRNDWQNTIYPFVPGHEIVGRVTAVGAEVTKYRPGDLVAVGCMVDSCRACVACNGGEEHYCEQQFTGIYNSHDRHDGTVNYGGYSSNLVTSERFVLKVPDGLDRERAAPLLCAGITTWSPLRRANIGPGKSGRPWCASRGCNNLSGKAGGRAQDWRERCHYLYRPRSHGRDHGLI